MIHTNDRAYWLGASDASMIVGNWKTKTWENWWMQKLGLVPNSNFSTKYTRAGNYYERYILRELGLDITCDYQIKRPEYSLRVNYDGVVLSEPHIYEVKSYNEEKEFKVSRQYWRQAQIEMFGLETDKLDIVAYPLGDDEYRDYFTPIDADKIQLIKVARDEVFLKDTLIPRLEILHNCLEKGIFPER